MKLAPLMSSALLLALALPAQAKDLRIPLPKKAKPTPVQNYNREGVTALDKHDYVKAKKLFYKAYLLDPNDPFTLNNLGYVAELEGDVDRARRFYDLSAAMNSDAEVNKSTAKEAEGKPVTQIAGHFEKGTMEVNKLNLEAISFLIKGRPFEAEKILRNALQVDANNPFTLNNMGYDMEMQGEMQKATEYYLQAANTRSNEPIIVAIKKDWRGKGISDIAAQNAERVQQFLAQNNTPEAQVALLNLRGVSALNRNDRKSALQYFQQAYQQDPNNAFALNNMGYLSELNGDHETAQLYYEKAQRASRADRRVSVASDPRVQGKRLTVVATNSDQLMDARMEALRNARRVEGAGQTTLLDRGFSQIAPLTEEPVEPSGPTAAPTTTPSPETTPTLKTRQPQPPTTNEVDPVPAPK
jgi:Flp pilus assembly protein TadD